VKPVTGDDPSHGGQDADAVAGAETQATLRALCEEKGEPYDGGLTESQAQERIRVLRGDESGGNVA
jgi:hypothetical protein